MNFNGQYNIPQQAPSWSPVNQQQSQEYYPPVDQSYMNQGYQGYYNGSNPNIVPNAYPPPPMPMQDTRNPAPASFSPVKAELRASAKEFIPNSGKSTPRTVEPIPLQNTPSTQINNEYYYINPPPPPPPPVSSQPQPQLPPQPIPSISHPPIVVPPLSSSIEAIQNPLLETLPSTVVLPELRCMNSLFLKKSLYDNYCEMCYEMSSSICGDNELLKEIPKQYNNIRLLDNMNSCISTGSFGYMSKVFKVVNINDGMIYCLRRIENVRLSSQIINKSIKYWLENNVHPLIIRLRESFLMNKALFVVHDYYPSAKTIYERYILNPLNLSESFLWSFILQITSVLYTLHMKKIACRCINSHRILETSPMKFHISGIGISDILLYDSKKCVRELMNEDVNNLGNLLIELSCKNMNSIINNNNNNNNENSISMILSNLCMIYSEKLIKFIKRCFETNITIFELYNDIQYESIMELCYCYDSYNNLNIELFKQYNASRLFHILLNLNIINNVNENFLYDKNVNETGKRYLLKLFNDYLFGEIDKDGNVIIDYGFIIDVLYKLDNECNEKIGLCSVDGKSLLIVSYSEIKHAMEECLFEMNKNGSINNNHYPNNNGSNNNGNNFYNY